MAVDQHAPRFEPGPALHGVAADIVLVLDRDGRVIEPVSGLPSGCDSTTIARVLGAETPAWETTVSQLDAASGVLQLEAQLDTADGQRLNEVRLSRGANGEILAVLRDISRRAALDRGRAEFINRVAHDLRTPLTTSMLMVDLLRGGGPPEEMAEYWSALSEQLQRQRDLLEQLLVVARLEVGSARVQLQAVELGPLLSQAVDRARLLAQPAGLRWTVDIHSGLPPVTGDTNALTMMLDELLTNARVFSQDGGVIEISARAGSGGAVIQVSDTGIGIPPDEVPLVFERFYRASNAPSSATAGAGVGLAVVLQLVEALGGRTRIASTLGKGTTVELRLPFAEE